MRKYIVIIILLVSFVSKAQVNISWPVDHSVFQRNSSTGGSATVWFAGQWTSSSWTNQYRLRYKIIPLDISGNEIANSITWTIITPLNVGKTFSFSKTINTGWYKFYVQLYDLGTNSQLGINSVKFGVGEVLILAGQSNAAGEGTVAYASESTYDCIVSSAQSYSNKCSGTMPVFPVFTPLLPTMGNISPNGFQPWAYFLLGKKIVTKESGKIIPVMFFNTGLSGTSSDDWSLTASNPNTDRSVNYQPRCSSAQGGGGVGTGEPFRSLRVSLNFYASIFGIRGVIWHQGEADNTNNVTSTVYNTNLKNVIQTSRDYFDANLAWAISNVSWDGASIDNNITSGQQTTRTDKSAVDAASNSDSFIGSTYRQTAGQPGDALGVHFNVTGLNSLASNYYQNISSLLDKTPILPKTLPALTITANTITAPSGYSCYQWVRNDGKYTNNTYPSGCTSSNISLTVNSTNAGIWRCYMKDTKGNVLVSQAVTILYPAGARISNITNESKVYPNPVSLDFESVIQFNLEEEANVNLVITDANGNIIQELANSTHAAGTYKYPFSVSKYIKNELETFYYKLTINGVSESKKIVFN